MSSVLPDGTVNEVLSLRQEVALMRKKLQDYGDTIVSLHGELRTLRDGICNACKRKFVPANLELLRDAKIRADDLSCFDNQPRVLPEHANPPGHSPRTPDCTPSSSEPPTSTLPSSQTSLIRSNPDSSTSTHIPPSSPQVENPVPISSAPLNKTIPKIEPSIQFSVRRHAPTDASATHAALDVTFVRASINKYPVFSVRFSPDSKYLAAGLANTVNADKDGAVVIYNVETGEKTCVLAENSSQYSVKQRPRILCLSFSPDGRYLATGDSGGQVTVWDILNKRIRNIFRGHSWSVESVNFSPNGRFVVSLSWHDGTMRLWNLRDGFSKAFSNGRDIWSVRFSPNGDYIAGGNREGILMIWGVRTGRLVKRWNSGEDCITRVAFTPDKRGLLSCHRNGSAKNWNISSLGVGRSSGGTIATTLEYRGLTKWIYGVAFSPCGRWVGSVSAEKSVIWDARSGVQQCTLIGHKALTASVDFSPSGKYLTLGSWDGHVSLWKYASA